MNLTGETVSQLASLIGRQGVVKQGGLGVGVVINDVKRVYGTTRFEIFAINGDGSKIWVDAERVVLA